ncbi:AsmA-like C-terminal region-containing protein [Mesorhizobium sp. BE184]|uniref:AsmA family protein n=1 Tax=Mesorhizobium sp. BE184 TaxID=2817714 RepID=UPI0028642723|nr:AsmA-like C-terminal region-containing protein [Mesorhizobium sp. BE184]MDR7035119.1 uncharacterized protein involved in outer membrane biogenesis [Mesorhizobium sp. BE184]
MLARLFVIFGGLFVLVLLAALVAPPFIDWTGYRADFEREASAILGRKVTVKGDATARLLPFPSVTFSDVSVAGGPDGQPAMTVETFSMDAELAPFLRGEVLIYDMRLVRPRATVDIAADGGVDWAIRPSSPFDAGHVAIEKLTVTEGQVTVLHESGARKHLLSEINSTISAKSLAGPWRMDGSLRIDGMRTKIAVATGRVDETGALRVRVRADPDAYPLTVETDGTARIDKGGADYSGQFRIAGDDKNTAQLRGSDGEPVKVSAGKAEPGYRLNGKFQLDHRKLTVDAFRFETGPLNNPYTADGKASVDLGPAPRFAVEASGAQMQFDEAVGADTKAGLTLAQRVSGLETALLDLPKPTIPGTVEVKLPAVVAGDTTIRDVRLSAEPAPTGWTVKSLAATLPGRTKLEASGAVSVAGRLGFKGSLLLAVAQPSGFAAWLSKDIDEAIRRLPAAGFKANVDMTDARQTFSDLELILGKARFHGSIDSAQPENARPSVQMKLDGDELDVEGLTAFVSLFVSDKGANRFADRDLDFQIKAGPVTAAGLTADRIDTALRLRAGTLEIDRLSVDGLAGAAISATGRIEDFPANPTGNIDASVVSLDLAPLIDAAARHYPGNAVVKGLAARARAYPGLFNEAQVDLVASMAGTGDGSIGVALSSHGSAGGSAFSASLSGQGRPDDLANAPLTVTFNAKNDDATALLALYGVPVLPLGVAGEGSTDLSAKGTLRDGLSTQFGLSGNDFSFTFNGTVANGQQGAVARGRASLDAADLEPWLMTTGIALPGMGAGMGTTLAADADYGSGLLVLSGLNGTINEAAVAGDINAEIKDGRPHLAGALELDELDLEPVATMLFGSTALESVAEGWPVAPFAGKSNAPFTADLDIRTGALAAGAFATVYDATMAFKLGDEALSVANLKGKLFGGELAGLFELKNNGGTGLFTGQATLSGTDLTMMLPDAGLTGAAGLTTTVSTSGKSVDAMIASLSGSGTVSLKGLTIANVNPQAFPAFITQADATGRDIDAGKTAAFAPALAAAGSFDAADTDIAFTLANGTLRAPPVTFENPAATLSADLSADLNAGTVAARGAIAYRPGDEALVGSEPIVNFSLDGAPGATVRTFDSAPLAQFLTQRALEKEQRRVEAMQASLLEKQRLRREVRYYAALQDERARAAAELRRQQEEAARKAEEDRKAAEEAARAKADAEAKAAADAEKVKAAEKAAAEEAGRKAAEKAVAEEIERKAEEAERIASEEKARQEAERKASRPASQPAPQPAPPAERTPVPSPAPQTKPLRQPDASPLGDVFDTQ